MYKLIKQILVNSTIHLPFFLILDDIIYLLFKFSMKFFVQFLFYIMTLNTFEFITKTKLLKTRNKIINNKNSFVKRQRLNLYRVFHEKRIFN